MPSSKVSKSPYQSIENKGNPERLERIIEAHDMRREGLFDRIVIEPKSVEGFRDAKRLGLELLAGTRRNTESVAVMVGDSMERDIKLANLAGFVTVYTPATFKGNEIPNTVEEKPAYRIERFADLLGVLRELGLPVSMQSA